MTDKIYYLGDYYLADDRIDVLKKRVRMPIEWIELEERGDGKSLLLSKDVIDWQLYGDRGKISWRESYIFEYLCGLYQTCFSKEEKDIIIKGKYGPLFLLSEEEIKKYIPSEKKRRSVMFMILEDEDGEIKIDMEHHAYWLRDDDASDWRNVPSVTSLGGFATGDSEADEMGVRVAMVVDTKQAKILTAKKGYNRWHHWWNPDEF